MRRAASDDFRRRRTGLRKQLVQINTCAAKSSRALRPHAELRKVDDTLDEIR
jgi:hypothetical protein